MIKCIYYLKSQSKDDGITYQQMVDFLIKNQDAYGILYSKNEEFHSKQDTIIDQLEKLKEIGIQQSIESKKLQESYNFMDDPELIKSDDQNYTTQTFVDSQMYVDKDGNPILQVMNNVEYLNYRRKLLESQGLSPSDIDMQISIIANSGKRIAKDGYDLHKIILQEWGAKSDEQGKFHDLNETLNNTKGTAFEDIRLSTDIHTKVHDKISFEVFKKNSRNSKEYKDMSSTRVIKNITLSASLNCKKNTKVFTHIDYIAIKPDGSIEIFFIKTSHENPSAWDKAKKEKYRHEAALAIQILAANGIDTSNVMVNMIPVILQYNPEFTEVKEIMVDSAQSLSHYNSGFILHEQLNLARNFIDSKVEPVEINDQQFKEVGNELDALFPEQGITASGIQQTAEDYLERNWHYLIVKELPKGYKIRIGNNTYDIQDSRRGKYNQEAIDLVKKHQWEVIDYETGELSAKYISSKIKDGRRQGFCDLKDDYLNSFFEKYYVPNREIEIDENTKKYAYQWEIISNPTLEAANIILFKNKDTKQVNVCVISPLDLKKKRQFDRQSNILGFHLSDMQAQDNQGNELLDATNGNLELMRGLFILNKILPTLGDDIKLGDIEVVGGLGTVTHGLTYPISLIVPNFIKARKILNDKDANLNINNNFANTQYVNPAELLMSEYSSILQTHSGIGSDFKSLRELFYGTGYSESQENSEDFNGYIRRGADTKASLQLAISQNTVDIQIARLQEIIEAVSKILLHQGRSATILKVDTLLANAKGHKDPLIKACSSILINASIALDRLSGIIRVAKEDVDGLDARISRPQNMEDPQVRITSKLLQDAIHQVSQKLDPLISNFNVLCEEYYKAKGYSNFRNFTIGDQVKVFKHLFKDDEEELIFKNPYEDSDLDTHDKKFLKRVLFIIAKIRFADKDFVFKDENDPNLIDFINKNSPKYFYVPLERASSSTKWTNPSKFFGDFSRRVQQYVHNPGMFFQEMYEGIMSDEERSLVTRDMENLQTRNPFRASNTERGRQQLLKRYGKDMFETNLQNLMIDYVFRHLQEEEMNKMLIRARGILLYLKIKGSTEQLDSSGSNENKNKYYKEIEHIDKYLTTTVFNRSIMEEQSQKIIAKITPVRKAVTAAYIAASPVAAVRDLIAGLTSNFVRSAIKFRTDIDAKDVAWAYKFVLSRGITSIGTIDLLDKMNAKYLISNINIEDQQEGYKTNTHGITNPGNIAYSTLRKPDYLNRMVLFVAKLKHDGSINAYSVEDGKLTYNWRMDQRFSLLNSGNTSDPEYNKQKARKLSLIMKLNEENPGLNLPLDVDTELPDGYSNQEIKGMQELGDVIYGSYNRSTKSMYEFSAIGSQFGVFSTWMNGIYDVYFGKRRASSYQFRLEQAQDANGNLLYFDENNNVTTVPTDVPYLKNVPVMVQGVLRTIVKDIGGDIIFNKGRGLKAIWNDPGQQMNIRRAISDLLVALFLAWLFKYFITPAYQEHKKNDDGKDIATNALIEIMYKGSVSSFDEMKGPLPIIEYVSDNTNPAAYKWLSRTGNDLFKLVTGDRSLGETITRAQALPRALQDTYKMYVRDTKNGVEE